MKPTKTNESSADKNRRKLIAWLKRKGPMTSRQVRIGCHWLREAGAAERALDDLNQSGLGEWEPIRNWRQFRLFDNCSPVKIELARLNWRRLSCQLYTLDSLISGEPLSPDHLAQLRELSELVTTLHDAAVYRSTLPQ